MTPAGDIIIDDRNELDEAYRSGELTKKQYENALKEGDSIVRELGSDITATEEWCMEVLKLVEEQTKSEFTIFLDVDGVLDVYNTSEDIQQLIPEAVDRLASLVKQCMAKVVVISDWRYGRGRLGTEEQRINWDNLMKTLQAKNIEISGVTSCNEKKRTRTEEIREYLMEHPEIKSYVILDDCYGDDYSSDEMIRKHLVFVDALKGLQDNNLMEACKIMNAIRM